MLQLRRILFPVDFSSRCEAVAGAVSALAQRTGAEVILVHAVSPPLEWIDAPMAPESLPLNFDFAALADSYRNERRQLLADFRPELWDAARTRRIVEIGDPTSVVLDQVKIVNPDLLMIPTHGRGVFRRLLMGSVTNKLLHDAHCPVWTDAHADHGAKPRRPACTEVLCCVDLIDLEHDRKLVDWAAGFAQIWGARLRLMHAVPGARHSPGTPDEPFTSTILAWGRETMDQLLKRCGQSLETVIEADTPVAVIQSLFTEGSLATVVIGRGRATGFLGRLGSQAFSIIRSSPVPVVSV